MFPAYSWGQTTSTAAIGSRISSISHWSIISDHDFTTNQGVSSSLLVSACSSLVIGQRMCLYIHVFNRFWILDQDFIGSKERFFVLIRYITVGIVKIVSILYSLDNLSLTISI